jgi:hypothetical protein
LTKPAGFQYPELTSLVVAVTAFAIPNEAASTPMFRNSLEYFAVCEKTEHDNARVNVRISLFNAIIFLAKMLYLIILKLILLFLIALNLDSY